MRRRLLGGLTLALAGAFCWTALVTAASDQPAIAAAAMRNDRAAVQALLQHGADVNAARADGMTALHWAAMNGDLAMARMLMYAGADVSAETRVSGLTPLALAAHDGHAALVAALLKDGADPNTADAYGTTPLMFAAAAGSAQAVSDLLNAGAHINAAESVRHETALMFAAAYGRTDAVRTLLAHHADWQATSRILDWAKLPKNDPRLLGLHAARTAKSKKAGVQPEKQARRGSAGGPHGGPAHGVERAGSRAQRSEPGSRAEAQVKKPAGPKRLSYVQLVGTQGGLTALLFAARQGYLGSVQALVQAGADVNEVDPGDKTSPLVIAIVNGRFDTAMYLLEHGADPNLAEVNGVTPLYAVLNCQWAPKAEYPHPLAYLQQKTGYLTLLKALLAHDANPNARLKRKVWYTNYNDDQSGLDEAGATPFWRAAYADDVAAMKLLVAHGADPNIPTVKPAGRLPTGAPYIADKTDKSGLPPVPVGGPDITPLLAASGEGYGWSFTANHHRYAPAGMLPAVKYLVDVLHADVNARDADGNTALHNAAARGDNAMILFLVSRGANVKAVNRKGQTVADMANGPFQRTQPFPRTIALLEKLGAKIMNKCVSC